MDYEKAYKAVLQTATQWIKDGCTDKEKICLECVFPELRESEDERIRKDIINLIYWLKGNPSLCSQYYNDRYDDMLAYLEKQKEQKPREIEWEDAETLAYIRDILKKYFLRSEEFEDIDRWLTEHYIEQKPAEWKPQPESLEALMYAIEGKWDMISPTSYLSRRLEDLYEGLVNTYNVDESLLAELPKTAYTAEDIEELKELKDKIDASMEQKPEERFEEAREKYQVEWGEEDERMLKSTIWHISNSLTNGKNTDCKCDLTEWLKEKLKSLRPSWKPSEQEKGALRTAIHILTDERGFPKAAAQLQNILNAFEGKEPRKDWKPSEEQMKALKEVAYSIVGTGTQTDVYLVQLYEQLKKLM